jgi:hypothetical protein
MVARQPYLPRFMASGWLRSVRGRCNLSSVYRIQLAPAVPSTIGKFVSIRLHPPDQ